MPGGQDDFEIEAPATAMRIEEREDGPIAVVDQAMPTLTVEQVRDTLEQIRR